VIKLKKLIYILTFMVFFSNIQIVFAEPIEKEYGYVNAWFNGEEATVEDIQLKIEEPAVIKVEVSSKIEGHVFLKIINPLVTESYEVISGPSKIGKRIDNLNVEEGWSEIYIWNIRPTGEWTGGNAPVNIFVEFSKAYDDDEHIEFTIANPYILNEQYSGPAPTRTATDPSSTDQPPGANGLPGFGVVGAVLGISLVLLSRKV